MNSALHFGHRFDVAARSVVGAGSMQREENQDNYLLIDHDGNAQYLAGQQRHKRRVAGWPRGHARLAVLDGMGGHGHGREAAETVVAGLLAVPACASVTELSQHLDALHARLQHHFSGIEHSPLRPGTTLTMLELPASGPALLYHVGDSRLYEISAGQATPLTVDHVPATAFAMADLIDERAWWQQVHGEHRPQISQAFVLGNTFDDPLLLSDPLRELRAADLPPWLAELHDRRPVALHPGSVYVLATDGFWSCPDAQRWVARWPELFAGRSSARAMLDALFGEIEAHPPAGLHSDNLTAIVLRPLALDETALPSA
ncbi:PP2C family protein-serine/threonine phosphatase [Massilia terrae]|uniref:Protein phosphatase 2C domain-containing protein n=1 Tax=Massilia terrae TaxID=1811224 RepID=A0ABT2CUL1_9BURK|nr:protein phosphatase 2C domain-containing protein [Massilia terrae]MCS0657663.1 protein phosphatase 2C domain-containing protein [Massilia terrae]